jgi:hypothetical protein
MGQSMSCACFEQLAAEAGLDDGQAAQERWRELTKEEKFTRAAMLGLSSQDIFVKLNDEFAAIKWRTEKTWTSAAEFGEIDLTTIKKVKLHGEQGIQFIGLDNETVVFELKHADNTVKDRWIVIISDILQSWVDKPDTKPKSTVTAAGTSNKAEYFKQREEEIKAREKIALERKAKYASGGLKYTAQIMAERTTTETK